MKVSATRSLRLASPRGSRAELVRAVRAAGTLGSSVPVPHPSVFRIPGRGIAHAERIRRAVGTRSKRGTAAEPTQAPRRPRPGHNLDGS